MTKFIRSTQDGNDFIIIEDETRNYKNRDYYNRYIKKKNKDKNIKWFSNNINNIIGEQLENQGNKIRNNYGLPMLNTKLHIVIDNYHINKNDNNIYQMLFNHKQYHINIIMFMDMYNNIQFPVELRSGIDYTVIFNNNDNQVIEQLYNQYAGMYETFNEFNNNLPKYGCLLINNNVLDNRVSRFNYLPCRFII